MTNHIPVLLTKVVEYLNPKSNENFIDCTIGGGGHALRILEKTGPAGRLLGIDWDPESLESARKILPSADRKRVTLVEGNFASIKEIARKEKFHPVHGILFDLGLSSLQLERGERGFSFRKDGPLDMRYNPGQGLAAEKIINYWSRVEIERILQEYGEERFAKRIAEEIVRQRAVKPITRTHQLVSIIERAVPKGYERGRIHPATRIFQALRIAVNNELENLKQALNQAVEVLRPGGRIVVISFHSLEDRIVKNFFKENKNLYILAKKPFTAERAEIRQNPRARSAKLRAARIF